MTLTTEKIPHDTHAETWALEPLFSFRLLQLLLLRPILSYVFFNFNFNFFFTLSDHFGFFSIPSFVDCFIIILPDFFLLFLTLFYLPLFSFDIYTLFHFFSLSLSFLLFVNVYRRRTVYYCYKLKKTIKALCCHLFV